MACLLLFSLLSCSINDPPSPAEVLHADMRTCKDLPHDTLFHLVEFFANGQNDTNEFRISDPEIQVLTRPGTYSGSWSFLQISGKPLPQTTTPETTPTTAYDSALTDWKSRRDSLLSHCDSASWLDTVKLAPLNHPIPVLPLQQAILNFISKSTLDTVSLPLPAGYTFHAISSNCTILIENKGGRAAGCVMSAPAYLKVMATATTISDTTTYPKGILNPPETLLFPRNYQGPWTLTVDDAYGFRDSLEFP
jgi:hypothetical protein